MTPFRERNPTTIGVLGFVVIALLLVAAFRADRLPLLGGGEQYTAEFAEVGMLTAGDEVRVAGVSVGRVEKITLDDDRVLVAFSVDEPMRLGDRTGAAIRIRTLLGAQYLALTPDGPGRLDEHAVIPRSRTQPPYDVVEAFTDLSTTTGQLDVEQLSEALTSVSAVAARTPEEFRSAIAGVSDLSRNLADRDDELNLLLRNLKKVTATINARDDRLEQLITDSDVLFRAVVDRRVAIQRILVSTRRMSDELRQLAADTRVDLDHALRDLETVTTRLARNAASLDRALSLFPAFGRSFGNALGVGPWFEGYVQL